MLGTTPQEYWRISRCCNDTQGKLDKYKCSSYFLTVPKYKVKISPKAYRELDSIYQYIAEQLTAPETALKTVDEIEKAILVLNEMPYRGSKRKIGVYANKGYRQIFVKKYTIVYRIDESNKMVIVITIRYSPSNF